MKSWTDSGFLAGVWAKSFQAEKRGKRRLALNQKVEIRKKLKNVIGFFTLWSLCNVSSFYLHSENSSWARWKICLLASLFRLIRVRECSGSRGNFFSIRLSAQVVRRGFIAAECREKLVNRRVTQLSHRPRGKHFALFRFELRSQKP